MRGSEAGDSKKPETTTLAINSMSVGMGDPRTASRELVKQAILRHYNYMIELIDFELAPPEEQKGLTNANAAYKITFRRLPT